VFRLDVAGQPGGLATKRTCSRPAGMPAALRRCQATMARAPCKIGDHQYGCGRGTDRLPGAPHFPMRSLYHEFSAPLMLRRNAAQAHDFWLPGTPEIRFRRTAQNAISCMVIVHAPEVITRRPAAAYHGPVCTDMIAMTKNARRRRRVAQFFGDQKRRCPQGANLSGR